jgi:hypothetical protein
MLWLFLDLYFFKAHSVALVVQVSTTTLQQAWLQALTMYSLHMASFTDVHLVFANAAWL